MRGKAQRVARPAQTRLGQWTKFHQVFLLHTEGSFGVVNAPVRVAILPSVALWNTNAQNAGGVCQYSPTRVIIGYHSNVP